jgi:hypothetical protein
MRGDEVKVGDVVTYRGESCRVVGAWRTAGKAPAGIPHPVGCVIELPAGPLVRLCWPCVEPDELQRGERGVFPRHDYDEATKARLLRALKVRTNADLEAWPIEAL